MQDSRFSPAQGMQATRTTTFRESVVLNDAIQALSFGVPIVAAGVSEDKSLANQRVAWSQTGIDLKTSLPSPEQIRSAVREILSNPAYRERARTLGNAIAKTDALKSMTELVRGVLARL